MDSQAHPSLNFSLCRGGLFDSAARWAHLNRGDRGDGRREIVALVGVTWLPLIVLGGLEQMAGAPARLLQEPSVHVRLLIAIPLLLWAARSLDWRCSVSVDELAESDVADANALDGIVKSASRLKNAWLPELALVVAAMAVSQTSLWGAHAVGLVSGSSRLPISASHLWYATVALPLFQFLLVRMVWRWAIWVRLLWQVSRLPLRLVPSHPDLCGGIGHLVRPLAALALVILAASAVVSASWAGRLLAGRAELTDLATPFALYVVVCQLIAAGPLMFFSGHLLRQRVAGRRHYADLAFRYTRLFEERWVAAGRANDGALLGAADIQSLADLANSFQIVEQIRLVPMSPRAIYLLFVASAVPMLPLLLTKLSIWELVHMVGGALIGGAH
jgi:hypothetical protein